MAKRSIDQLGELQRAVMQIVWELGEATVQQVRQQLKRTKQPAYTTVLSVMQKLEKQGWLCHKAAGRQYVYMPKQTIRQAGAKSLSRFIDRVFQGDALLMFQHLIEDDNLDDGDLAALRKMLDQRKKGVRDD